jgi:hypothetical protein
MRGAERIINLSINPSRPVLSSLLLQRIKEKSPGTQESEREVRGLLPPAALT